MALPHELVSVVCFFCDQPSLTSVCLSNKAFYSEARPILYGRIFFRNPAVVAHFMRCAEHRLSLVKHLVLFIPGFYPQETEVWIRLLSGVHKAECLVCLRMSWNPTARSPGQDFLTLVGGILGMPSLKYVAITTELVPAVAAVQCPALKELEGNNSWTNGLARFGQEKAYEKPKLNTLCHGWEEITLPLLKSLFDLRGLTRLAMNQQGDSSLGGMSELMAETCSTLQQLALWVLLKADKGWITKITNLKCPNLRILALLHRPGIGNEVYWETCALLVSALLSISPQLQELRLYIHNCGPPEILSTPLECIPNISPQILVIRVFCWNSSNTALKALETEAEERLRERLGRGRDFSIEWNKNWSKLTTFCEPRDQDQW
ncbi:hypothetical protein DL96DRAFT_1817261 [Flagelloscypha sp. PMI_526]|nr:hypothetical protein DL96DRAFT_1817261 [Flagelloscypha sp. PMI_526]